MNPREWARRQEREKFDEWTKRPSVLAAAESAERNALIERLTCTIAKRGDDFLHGLRLRLIAKDAPKVLPAVWNTEILTLICDELYRRCVKKFMAQHQIDDEAELADPVNLTLFDMQHPGVRPTTSRD